MVFVFLFIVLFPPTPRVWVSDLYPKLSIGDVPSVSDASTIVPGDSPTQFKQDLLIYLSGYGRQRLLEEWITVVKEHDMSNTRFIVIIDFYKY